MGAITLGPTEKRDEDKPAGASAKAQGRASAAATLP